MLNVSGDGFIDIFKVSDKHTHAHKLITLISLLQSENRIKDLPHIWQPKIRNKILNRK